MERSLFKIAKAIFYPYSEEEYAELIKNNAVMQYGFFSRVDILAGDIITVNIAARNVYRLFVNGVLAAHGPARTAHGYARVDRIDISSLVRDGDNCIAVELMCYGRYCGNEYSNDSTLESGMLALELECDGETLLATGRDEMSVCRISSRVSVAERISHCRGAIEIYKMDKQYHSWRVGEAEFIPAAKVKDEPVYLERRSPYPRLCEHAVRNIVSYGSCFINNEKKLSRYFYIKKNEKYYSSLDESPTDDCRRTQEEPRLGVSMFEEGGRIRLSGDGDKYIFYDTGESRVGFLSLDIDASEDGIIDIARSEALDLDGGLQYHFGSVIRLYVARGKTVFTAIEPGLFKYLKLYFRGAGDIVINKVSVIEYTYPDAQRSSFECSDPQINELYAAAKKTLVLNTMDILMDCPDRERGGWLCDSFWSGRAAAYMLCDPSVEGDFIENFMLTDPNKIFRGFFPSVYPGNIADYTAYTDDHISTWSFWLMCELCEYVRRTGDVAFRDRWADRVNDFVERTFALIGECGLLEELHLVFIDWSLSNEPEFCEPVSVAANALYSFMLAELGRLYERKDWSEKGKRIREILRSYVLPYEGMICDGLEYEDGELVLNERMSEAAIFTSLWSGLLNRGERSDIDFKVLRCMGPAPEFPPYATIARSNLFIGLCVRLDMLSRYGCVDKMYEDMKAIYLPQLREGPGTLWENQYYDTSSRCHSFAAHAGVHLLRDVLGIEYPDLVKNTITISPHICGLSFARGSFETPFGVISAEWKYNVEGFVYSAVLPKQISYKLVLPPEIKALGEDKINVNVVCV